jgi:polyribonucleotide nucleotidyltransferase
LLCSGVKVRRLRKAQDWKGNKLTVNTAVEEVHTRNSIAGGATSSTAVTAFSTSTSNGNVSGVTMSLTYAGSPDKATAIEATGQQTAETAFVAAMRLAAVSTQPLIQAQQALAAAVLAQQQEQQRRQLAQLWPSQQLQQTVRQLTEQPLKALFTKQLGSNGGGGGSSSSSSSDKESRAAALSIIQSELLRDLQRMGLLAEAGQLTAAAAAGQVSREDALRAFDVLQSRVMREVLLENEVSDTNTPLLFAVLKPGHTP